MMPNISKEEAMKLFDVTLDEYKEYRFNMIQSRILLKQNAEENECSILYFDGDDGLAYITNYSDVHDDGFSISLIDCNYCNISYAEMTKIVDIFEDFKEMQELDCLDIINELIEATPEQSTIKERTPKKKLKLIVNNGSKKWD
jgi:hypothetical protein